MGAPIKINKDLLVIAPNYTKKWLAEGQLKVSGPHSWVALCPPSIEDLTDWGCQDAPPGPPEIETKASAAQGHLILPLSYHEWFFHDYTHTHTHKKPSKLQTSFLTGASAPLCGEVSTQPNLFQASSQISYMTCQRWARVNVTAGMCVLQQRFTRWCCYSSPRRAGPAALVEIPTVWLLSSLTPEKLEPSRGPPFTGG